MQVKNGIRNLLACWNGTNFCLVYHCGGGCSEFWRQICFNLAGVAVGGDANPARTGVALHGFILDELKTPRALFSPAGGLKTHHAPLFGSCD